MKRFMLLLLLVFGSFVNSANAATLTQEEAISHISEFDAKDFENFSSEALQEMLIKSYEELKKTKDVTKKAELTKSIETLEDALTIIEAKATGKWQKLKGWVKDHKYWVISGTVVTVLATLAAIYYFKYYKKPAVDPETENLETDKTPLADTTLNARTVNILTKHNFEYLEDVQGLSDEALRALSGIGEARIQDIRDAQSIDKAIEGSETEIFSEDEESNQEESNQEESNQEESNQEESNQEKSNDEEGTTKEEEQSLFPVLPEGTVIETTD